MSRSLVWLVIFLLQLNIIMNQQHDGLSSEEYSEQAIKPYSPKFESVLENYIRLVQSKLVEKEEQSFEKEVMLVNYLMKEVLRLKKHNYKPADFWYSRQGRSLQ